MPENGKSKESERHLESLMKGLQVLDCLQGHPALTITEIANELGLYKSRVMRICGTLEHMGYVVYGARERVYRLGPRIPALARSYDATHPLLGIVKPAMEALSSELRRSVSFHKVHGDALICIHRIAAYENYDHVGLWQDRTFYCGSQGRIMLAFGSEELRESYLSSNDTFPQLTPYTITSSEALRRALELVQEQGYAVTSQEREMGRVGIAAPVFQYGESLIGVLSVFGKIEVFDDTFVKQAVPVLLRETRKLSLRFGAEERFLENIGHSAAGA